MVTHSTGIGEPIPVSFKIDIENRFKVQYNINGIQAMERSRIIHIAICDDNEESVLSIET